MFVVEEWRVDLFENQSSSHEGLLLVVDDDVVGVDSFKVAEKCPLVVADSFTSSIPESVTLTPRFSSICL